MEMLCVPVDEEIPEVSDSVVKAITGRSRRGRVLTRRGRVLARPPPGPAPSHAPRRPFCRRDRDGLPARPAAEAGLHHALQ